MAKKPRTVEFRLSEDGSTVTAALLVDGRRILELENEDAPAARVRHGKPDKTKILQAANYWSARDDRFGHPSAWLNFAAARCEVEMLKQIREVRKAIKRIEGIMAKRRTTLEVRKSLNR